MNIFMVREQESKTIIGIYWGRNIIEIWETINKFCDPYFCEYIIMPPTGGVIFDEIDMSKSVEYFVERKKWKKFPNAGPINDTTKG